MFENRGRLEFHKCTLVNLTQKSLEADFINKDTLLHRINGTAVRGCVELETLLAGGKGGVGASLSPLIQARVRDYLSGKLEGAGFALTGSEIGKDQISLVFNFPVDFLSHRAGIRVFDAGGREFDEAVYEFKDFGRRVTVSGFCPSRAYRIYITDELRSTRGRFGIREPIEIGFPEGI